MAWRRVADGAGGRRRWLSLAWATLLSAPCALAEAQVPDSVADVESERRGKLQISQSKRMRAPDLARKREGWFVTGLPELSSDPVSGFGYGARGYLFFAGRRDDPLFAYTPYRLRLKANLVNTTEGAREANLSLDLPYAGGSRWRIRIDGKHQNNPNNLYFGLTEATLAPLPQGSYAAYAATLAATRPGTTGEDAVVTDVLRNRFREREWMLNLKADRALGDGRVRILGGYELQSLRYETFQGRLSSATDGTTGAPTTVPNGQSLLAADAAAGRVAGAEGGRVSLLQAALIFDTRDFEPDPGRGVFLELANEFSSPVIGSEVTFDKLFFQARGYVTLASADVQRLVLGGRVGVGNIFGTRAPFFEYQDQWSTEGSVNALGGSRTLRGYKANRFLGRAVALANVELRWRVGERRLLGQRFALQLVPFADAGTVRDRFGDLASLGRIRTSWGAGVRVAWNQSTIVAADWAWSREDAQFFFGFGHPF